MLRVTAIIPTTYAGSTVVLFEKCISTLLQSADGIVDLRIVAVTNHKEKLSEIKRLSRAISVLYVDGKPGFAEMNNAAIESTIAQGCDYFLLINDDAYVHSTFFAELVKLHNSDSVAEVLAPFIYNTSKNCIDSFGVEYFVSGYAKNNPASKHETTLASASCLVISTELLQRINRMYGFIFNELLYYYLEDVELMIRAAMVGGTIKRYRELVAYHQGSTTSKEKSWFPMFHTYRNILWVILMTWPIIDIVRNSPSIFLVQCWVLIYSLRKYGLQIYLRVLYETIQNWSTLLSLRKSIQKAYLPGLKFSRIFSPFSFRTYHNIKIPSIRLW